MGVRFNKTKTILPWLKMNVGKNGVSLTVGPKGKTLNIGSTGVNVNVSLGKGVGYSKRLITWKKLNLLSWLGIGGAAATKAAGKGRATRTPATKGGRGTTVPSLDEAIREAEAAQADTAPSAATAPDEQAGCSWGCAALGCLGALIILALLAVVAWLLWQQYGDALLPAQTVNP